MMIPTINPWQLVLTSALYVCLIVQGYLLWKFIKKHSLLHMGVVPKLRAFAYAFTILLIIKLAFSIAAIEQTGVANLIRQYGKQSDGFNAGFYTGYYAGHYVKTIVIIIFQNTDLIFAVVFMWLLIFVFKEAIKLKQEQELTI